MQPYLRQIILSEVGMVGQKALTEARVLIVGAGGLGTPAAQYLVAAGVGQVTILDGDVVSETNLHRQVLYRSHDLGRLKVEVMRERLVDTGLDAGRHQEIHAIPEMLTVEWGLTHFSEYDVILDGTDNFAAKFLLNDLAIQFRRPLVSASVMKWEGQLLVSDPARGPCYRCLYPDLPQGQIQNCAEAGVMGAVVGVLGSWQALEVIKLILQKTTTNADSGLKVLRDELMLFDFTSLQVMKLKRERRPGCRCVDPDAMKIDSCDYQRTELCQTGPLADAELDSCRDSGVAEDVLWIDVREKEEWDTFHWPQAVHFPLSRLEKGLRPDWIPGRAYGLVCVSGARARRAYEILKSEVGPELVLFPGGVYDRK